MPTKPWSEIRAKRDDIPSPAEQAVRQEFDDAFESIKRHVRENYSPPEYGIDAGAEITIRISGPAVLLWHEELLAQHRVTVSREDLRELLMDAEHAITESGCHPDPPYFRRAREALNG